MEVIFGLAIGIAGVIITGAQWYLMHQRHQHDVNLENQRFEHEKELARFRKNLDMFEKRWPLYEALSGYAASAILDGKLDKEMYRTFLSASRGAEFLFDLEIEKLCKSVTDHSIDWFLARGKMERGNLSDEDYQECSSKDEEHLEFFQDLLDDMPKIFMKYMRTDFNI